MYMAQTLQQGSTRQDPSKSGTLSKHGRWLAPRPVPAEAPVATHSPQSSSMAKGWKKHLSDSPEHPSTEMQELNFLPNNTKQSESLFMIIMFSQSEIQIYLIAVNSLQGSLLVLFPQDN